MLQHTSAPRLGTRGPSPPRQTPLKQYLQGAGEGGRGKETQFSPPVKRQVSLLTSVSHSAQIKALQSNTVTDHKVESCAHSKLALCLASTQRTPGEARTAQCFAHGGSPRERTLFLLSDWPYVHFYRAWDFELGHPWLSNTRFSGTFVMGTWMVLLHRGCPPSHEDLGPELQEILLLVWYQEYLQILERVFTGLPREESEKQHDIQQ